jgi:hypothetical protein
MIRAFLAEWVARQGIQWAFTCQEKKSRWAAWLSSILFLGSHRGTLLSSYLYLEDSQLNNVISRMKRYYESNKERAKWGNCLDAWRSSGRFSNPLIRKLFPRIYSLANTWLRLQPIPKQVQYALWQARNYPELANLAQSSQQVALRAHALFAGGNPVAAMELLAQIPNSEWNGEATYLSAKSFQSRCDYQSAIALLENAIIKYGAGRQTRQLLVELYRQVGQEINADQEEKSIAQDYKAIHNIFLPPQNGRTIHIITEDHELTKTPGKSEDHPWLSIREARVQLVDKGRQVNKIASNCGTPWTHLIDIGSYTVLKAAAEIYPASWGDVLSDYESFLTETIASGNDLGVHVHPDKSWLIMNKIEPDCIYLNQSGLGWGNLSRFNNIGYPSSKVGFVIEGKTLVERFGQLADPSFHVKIFRSGSYSMGSTLFETAESIDALCSVGLNIGSDALELDGVTESLGRKENIFYGTANGAIWRSSDDPEFFQILPLRTKLMPVYSVIEAARHYRKNMGFLSKLEQTVMNVDLLVSMDHDIEIGNAKSGGKWDDLNLNSPDWSALSRYLEAIGKSKTFRCIRFNDLVLHYY